MEDLSYATITQVIGSWEQLRGCDKNYEQAVGARLLHHMFERCRCTKPLFGVSVDEDTSDPAFFQQKKLLMHGSYIVQMFGTVIGMLGPDMETIEEILGELGGRHARYGVQPAFFPIMGAALVTTLEEMLGAAIMTDAVKEAWMDTFDALASHMIVAMTRERIRRNI